MLPEDIEADYWAHHFFDNPASESSETDDYAAEAEALMNGEWEEVISMGEGKDG